jgi:alkylhydroperoxidase family enzyme
VVQAVLDDWRTAPIREPLRAMLGMLAILTLTPKALTPADLELVRAAGVSDQAIEDAIAVCAVFSTINRVADTLNFAVSSKEQAARGAAWTLEHGYKLSQRAGG